MPITCLPLDEANKIKKALKDGTLNPNKLNNMTSAQRRMFLSTIVGRENAKNINLEFEKKLLLVNQELAMIRWAKGITGIGKEAREATLQKIRDTYAEKKRRVEDPRDDEIFLNEIVSDVYSKKFKTEVSLEEAQMITELTQDVKQAKDAIEADSGKIGPDFKWKSEASRTSLGINYGAAKVAMDNYISGLKAEANKKYFINPFTAKKKIEALKTDAGLSIDFIADNSRAIKASLDNSLWGRQGIKALYNHPTVWAKNFSKSWIDIWQSLKGGSKSADIIIDGVKAEIYSRENFLNGRYTLGTKLDVGIAEEEFPTSLPQKIPALGRLFTAAEVSYEAGAMRLRVDIADIIYELGEQTGVDFENKIEVGSINKMINSQTGRGELRLAEEGVLGQKSINRTFFSVKFFKSNIDTLTMHAFDKNMSSFAKKRAAINLGKSISAIALILFLFSKLDEDNVEWDPRSANFGKIRKGNARFDITGGMSSYVIFITRIIMGIAGKPAIKSSVTGITTKMNEGFSSINGMDLFFDFLQNKTSPLASVLKNIVSQKTFEGEKPTLVNQLGDLTIPIIIEQGMDMKGKESLADTLLVLIADGLGISANVYSYNDNWENKTGKELLQFKEKVGNDEFKKANELYIKQVNEKIIELKTDDKYQKLDNEEKQQFLTNEKSKIKDKIFRNYQFKYRKK